MPVLPSWAPLYNLNVMFRWYVEMGKCVYLSVHGW